MREMREQLALETPWKIGAGLRGCDIELGKVLLLFRHVFFGPVAVLTIAETTLARRSGL